MTEQEAAVLLHLVEWFHGKQFSTNVQTGKVVIVVPLPDRGYVRREEVLLEDLILWLEKAYETLKPLPGYAHDLKGVARLIKGWKNTLKENQFPTVAPGTTGEVDWAAKKVTLHGPKESS